jgi:hypothetical protein
MQTAAFHARSPSSTHLYFLGDFPGDFSVGGGCRRACIDPRNPRGLDEELQVPIVLIKLGKNIEIKEVTPFTAYVDEDTAVIPVQ